MAELGTLPCPGCHTPLPPEASGCQICMRSRTKQEILRGYAKLRDDAARKRRRPFQLLAAFLLLGGGGKLIATYRGRLSSAAGKMGAAVGRWADNMRDPKNYAPQLAGTEAPKPPTRPGAPVAPEDALRAKLLPPDPPPAQVPTPAVATPGGPKPLAKHMWRVSGMVYDLATLRTVARSAVIFQRDGNEPVTATTDENGDYTIDLQKADGWDVSIKAPNRRQGGLLDADPSYRIRDADERRAVMEQMTNDDLSAARVEWKRAKSKVRLDLIVVPAHWTDIDQDLHRPPTR